MKHYNPTIAQIQNRVFNLKEQPEAELMDEVVQTFELKPKGIVAANFNTASGTLTVLTTPAEKDFYMTGFAINFIKDAACDNTAIYLSASREGLSSYLFICPIITLTAQQFTQVIEFPNPVKIDRSTSITLAGSFTAGACSRSVTISGYELEVTR